MKYYSYCVSVSAIRGLLQCPSDDAIAILRDLRVRKLIDLESTPDGQLDARKPMPCSCAGFDQQHIIRALLGEVVDTWCSINGGR